MTVICNTIFNRVLTLDHIQRDGLEKQLFDNRLCTVAQRGQCVNTRCCTGGNYVTGLCLEEDVCCVSEVDCGWEDMEREFQNGRTRKPYLRQHGK